MLNILKKIKIVLIITIVLLPVITIAQVELLTFFKSHKLGSTDNGLLSGLVLNLDAEYQNLDTLLKRNWVKRNGNHNSSALVNYPKFFSKSPSYFLLEGNYIANLNFKWHNDFTCILWVYPLGTDSVANSSLLSTSDNLFEITINNDSQISYFTKDEGWQHTKAILNKNNWNQIVCVKTGNNLKIYLNAKNVSNSFINLKEAHGVYVGQKSITIKEVGFRLHQLSIYKVNLSAKDISLQYEIHKLKLGI
jgi:hypothetical protein